MGMIETKSARPDPPGQKSTPNTKAQCKGICILVEYRLYFSIMILLIKEISIFIMCLDTVGPLDLISSWIQLASFLQPQPLKHATLSPSL